MRHKNKNAHKDNDGAFDHLEKFNTPEGAGDVPNTSDQAQGVKPEEPIGGETETPPEPEIEKTPEGHLVQEAINNAFPKPAKKNGFMAMLEERNQKRKARLKKLNDERNKKA